MHTPRHIFLQTPGWRDQLLELATAALAFIIIALATWLFCWCFYIQFHFRYSIGAFLAILMLKWIVPNLQIGK